MTQLQPYTAHWFQFCPHCKTDLAIENERTVKCPACGFAFYTNPAPCVTVVIAKGEQVLLCKRAFEPKKDLWNFAGGFIDPGETAEDAIHREIEEELGATMRIITQLGPTVPDVYGEFQDPTLTFLYFAELTSDNIQANDDVSELKWMNMNEVSLELLAFKNDRIALERYKNFVSDRSGGTKEPHE